MSRPFESHDCSPTRGGTARRGAGLFLGAALLCCLLAGSAAAAQVELAGPDGTSVTINGQLLGFLPLTVPVDLAPGRHRLVCTLPGHRRFEQEIRLVDPSEVLRLHVRLTPFSRRTAVASSVLFAGLGQFYLEKNARGWFYAGVEAGGLILALVSESARVNARDDHLLLLERYDGAINADEITALRAAAEAEYQDMLDAEDRRDLGLVVAGAAVVVSVIDALVTFPGLEAGSGPVPVQVGLASDDVADRAASMHAGVRLQF